jgi:hypothetical protein
MSAKLMDASVGVVEAWDANGRRLTEGNPYRGEIVDEAVERLRDALYTCDTWTAELVRLANAYREAAAPESSLAAYDQAKESLLDHAYNGGKAP